MERYRKVFGPLEHNVTIGGVEFVFVDAQALDGKDYLLCPRPAFDSLSARLASDSSLSFE